MAHRLTRLAALPVLAVLFVVAASALAMLCSDSPARRIRALPGASSGP